MTATRAVRNNNPLNIKIKDKWQGLMPLDQMTDEQKDEKVFCVFQSPKWGFRAAARILILYQDEYELRTIAGVVTRWAPPGENDTGSYIKHVCELTGLDPTDQLDFHMFESLRPVIKAMAIHESGSWLFEDADLDSGLTLAGAPPPVAHVAKSKTVTVAASGLTATAVIEAVQQLQPAIGVIGQMKDYAPQIAVGVLALVVVVMVLLKFSDWRHARQ